MDCLELVYCKKYFNLANIFVLRLFKITAYQIECFRLEQRSVIKFLVAEKCKPYEDREKCVVYKEKHVLVKNVYEWAKNDFATAI